MDADKIQKQIRRRTGLLPALAAVATLTPAVAGLALATGRADASRPAVGFHCSNEHGNGTSANPLDDNTDHGLDAGATAGNTGGTQCSTTTSAPVTSTPSSTSPSTSPSTVPATVDPTDPTVTTVAPSSTSVPTLDPTDPTVTTVAPSSPTVATIPAAQPIVQTSTTAVTTTAATTTAVTTRPTTVPPTTAGSTTTAPAVLRFVGPTTTWPDPTSIPVEIAPNDGAIVNPTPTGPGATRPGSAQPGTPQRTTPQPTTPQPVAPQVQAFTVSRTATAETTVPAMATSAGTAGADGIGLTPPPVEVLGISVSRISTFSAASAPTTLTDELAFTGSATGRLAALASAVVSLGLGLATLRRRREPVGR